GAVSEQLPWLGQVDDRAIDAALDDPGTGIGHAQRPVRRRTVMARDVVACHGSEVLADFVRDQLAGWTDRSQEGEGERRGTRADLDHVMARSDVAPEEKRPDVLGIDRLRLAGQARDELRIGGTQHEKTLAGRGLDHRALWAADDGVTGDGPAAHGDTAALSQGAEVAPALAVEQHHRLAVAQQGPRRPVVGCGG